MTYANVLACMLFGAISGSATAATSSVGSFMIPEMERKGYGREFSTALTVSASTLGLIIPPSNIMIIFAVAWGNMGQMTVDVAAMFMSGFLPGIIIGLGLMIVAGIHAFGHRIPPTGGIALGEGLLRFKRAILSMLLMVIVLGGISLGFFTATQASAVAVLYSFLLAVVVLSPGAPARPAGDPVHDDHHDGVHLRPDRDEQGDGQPDGTAGDPQTVAEGLVRHQLNKVLLLVITT